MRPRFHEGFKLIATVLSTGYLTACNITGYDTQNKCLKWPGALTQNAFQDYEKIN